MGDLLFSLHMMGASAFHAAELELDREEAKKLGDAISEVAKHYSVNLNPKHLAVFNLFAVCGGIYGPRFLAMGNNRRNARNAAKLHSMPGAATGTNGAAAWQDIDLGQTSGA